MGKYVVLADCAPDEVKSFADALEIGGNRFEIESHIANWKRTGSLSEIKRYATYFTVGFRTLINRREYSVIMGWQQFYALTFSFFCELFRVRKATVTVALNFTYKEKKGKVGKIYRWFMGKCVSEKYLDYIHVLSDSYADIIAEEFHFPRERIVVTGFGVNDKYTELSQTKTPGQYGKDQYALAIGRSNRDYDFLIDAWEEIDYPLVIISDTYEGTATGSHISILRNVAGAESEPWIANCGLMIIPIADGQICSGDTVLLTAMSLKRKIIVTKPSTLAEMYVINGENAILSPKQPDEFRWIVKDILMNDRYETLGETARESFLEHYSRRNMGAKIIEAMRNHETQKQE